VRISPRPLAAVIVFLVYLAFFYGVWIATSVEYNDIGDAVDTLLKWYVAPTWIGGLFLIIAVSWLGWWRPVLFEKNRAPRWVLIAPLFMLALVIVFLFFSDYSGLAAGMIPVLILGSIGVGFSEEVVSRGVIVTGFRSRFTEPWVWFWSCFLFAILHLPNWFFGLGPSAVGQVLLAFGAGSTLYLLRRGSGTLWWAIALHAVWDFATIGGEAPLGLTGLLFINAVLGFVVAVVMLRRERGRRIEQVGVPVDESGSESATSNTSASG